MKYHITTRTGTSALALIAWLVLPQTAHCFYNSSNGRWLSRDPVGEKGGKNLYTFVGNQALTYADRDGREMILREHFFELARPPAIGEDAGANGLTFFQMFSPKAWVYQGVEGPCCSKIAFGGVAILYSWWVSGAVGLDGTPSKDHEMQHVACARATFGGYNSAASSFTGICYSKPKAECFTNLILGDMLAAFGASYDTSNMEIDCHGYGMFCDALPAQTIKEVTAWQRVIAALSKCAAIQ